MVYEAALAFVAAMDARLKQGYLPCPRDVLGNELRALDEVVLAIQENRWPGLAMENGHGNGTSHNDEQH